MFSGVVLIGLILLFGGGLYLLLAVTGVFNKVGDSVIDIKDEVLEKDSEGKNKNENENKGRDV